MASYMGMAPWGHPCAAQGSNRPLLVSESDHTMRWPAKMDFQRVETTCTPAAKEMFLGITFIDLELMLGPCSTCFWNSQTHFGADSRRNQQLRIKSTFMDAAFCDFGCHRKKKINNKSLPSAPGHRFWDSRSRCRLSGIWYERARASSIYI